jgi:TerC family integral membrane protein
MFSILLWSTHAFTPASTIVFSPRGTSWSIANSAQSSSLSPRSKMHLNIIRDKEQLLDGTSVAAGEVNGVADGEVAPFDDIYQSALQRTALWVAAACIFGAGLFTFVSSQTSEEFFAGYLLEQSLSVDNLLVFLLLFDYFKVPLEYQDRVLNWGIIGAIVMRAFMIGVGAVAIHEFHSVLLVFAGILIYSSGKILLSGEEDDEEEDLSQNQIVQFSNNLIKSTDKFDGDRFFTLVEGVKTATPLLLCMVAVEISDVVFAVDSIPAVFGVTEVRADS